MARRGPLPDPVREIDLHGLGSQRAIERLRHELTYCRARRMSPLSVVTGRGLGSAGGKPVLRPLVRAWLEGEGRSLGVVEVRTSAKGGALWVRLRFEDPGRGG